MEPVTITNPADLRVEVATSEAVAFSYALAGLGSRMLAFALDLLVLGLVLTAESVVAWIVFAGLQGLGEAGFAILPWVGGAFVVTAFVTFWGYFIVLEAVVAGRTPGKRSLGIRVVREDGGRIGLLDAVVRNILLIVDLLPGTFAVGIVSILLTPRAQRLGDLAAGTIVVREAEPGAVPPAVDPRVRMAEEYLARRERLTPEARAQVGAEVLAAFGERAATADDEALAARLGMLAARPAE